MAGSWRRQPLPPGWAALRIACLNRDGWRCRWPVLGGLGGFCGAYADQADHVSPDGPQDDLGNLRALCAGHHKSRSSAQGGAAAGIVRRQIAGRKTRAPERHPGYLR